MSDLSITHLPTLGMITLRGDPEVTGAAVEAVAACAPPERRLSTISEGCRAMWMSSDELMLTCDHGRVSEMLDRLTAHLGDAHAMAVDVSDARAVFALRGEGAEALLAKLMPVDFAKLDPTEVRRTRMAQIPAAIWREEDGWRIMCFRSVARYAADLLEDARPVGA